MNFPDFINQLPLVDIGIPELHVRVLSGEQSVAFISVLKDVVVPPHHHGAQWGWVLAGQVRLTADGKTKEMTSGDTYFIPAGTVHGASLIKGTRLIEFFEERDRFQLPFHNNEADTKVRS